MTIFSKNLKRFRLEKKLTQEQAASRLGVSTQSVSRWECGTTLPDVTLLPQIAMLYCVTIDDLYKSDATAYDNYAQRLGSLFEYTRLTDDFLRAELEYQRLIRNGQASAEDLRLFGVLYQQMMETSMKHAFALYDQVLAQGPDRDPEVYWRTKRQKIRLRSLVGKSDESIREASQKKEAQREENDWICLIAAYQYAGRSEDARAQCGKALKRYPNSPFLWFYCGQCLAEMDQGEEALNCWNRVLTLEPEFYDAMYAMAEHYQLSGQWKQAWEVWKKLAGDLAEQGFDSETVYAQRQAELCAQKIGDLRDS